MEVVPFPYRNLMGVCVRRRCKNNGELLMRLKRQNGRIWKGIKRMGYRFHKRNDTLVLGKPFRTNSAGGLKQSCTSRRRNNRRNVE